MDEERKNLIEPDEESGQNVPFGEDPAHTNAEALQAASEQEKKKLYKTGSLVAAMIFFVITLVIFGFYEFFCFTFLYGPLIHSPESFGEAIAAVFGYIYGFVITIIFGLAQIPANITAIILTSRLRGKSDKKGVNVFFNVLFALSIVMLVVMILSIGLFLAIVSAS